MREFSVPPVVTLPDDANLSDPVWDNAAQFPDDVQFSRRTAAGWQDVTCAEFRDEVVALARGMIAAGLEPGDRIGLMSKTRYEWTLLDYAIWAAGGISVPIYETSSTEQVHWILSDSAAVACFVETAEHEAIVAGVRDQLPELRHLWQIDQNCVADLGAAGADVPAEEVATRRKTRRGADVATLIYTSGTTGRPKGCILTHHNMRWNITNTITGLRQLFNERSSLLQFMPLAHSLARIIQIGTVEARVRLGHTSDIKNLLDDLKKFQPTFLVSVPRIFEKVYNAAKQRAHADGKGKIFDRADRVAVAYSQALDTGGAGPWLRLQHAVFDKLVYTKLRAVMGGKVTHAVSGGAPLGARLAHFFRGVGITIFEGYGLTETSPVTSLNLEHAIKIGTVGRPVPGVTVQIADDGEILIHGDHIFQGYWNNEAATAETLTADRWLHSGDMGELDADGYLTITGRKKELLVTAGGKNVAPAVLEDRVRAHPLISQCMVIGDRQPFIAALVTIDEDAFPTWKEQHAKAAEATIDELSQDADLRAEVQSAIDEANKAVSRAESIREFRILPRDFTVATGDLTPSLKVKRNVVMKEYADEIATIYA